VVVNRTRGTRQHNGWLAHLITFIGMDPRTSEADTELPAIGVGTPLGFGIPTLELVSYATAADQAGLHDISLGELRGTEAFSLASAFASHTTSIRVETSIVAVVTRSAPLLAMGAATLSQLSGGRFRLGVGAGSPIVAAWHGTEFTAPVAKVERTIDLVRAALAGERLGDAGSFRIAPEMEGEVPIVISAMNRRMLTLAGRKADGVILQFCGPREAAEMGAIARDAHRTAGNERSFDVMVNVWAYAGQDRSAALRAFRREVAPYMAVPPYRTAAVTLASAKEIDAVGEEWKRSGRDAAADLVPQAIADQLLFVLGDDDLAERLATYRAAGCDRVRFIPLTPVPGDVTNAREVVSRLSELAVSGRSRRASSMVGQVIEER
jgi:5,10-methylenetetrahydromethanopterin reductase